MASRGSAIARSIELYGDTTGWLGEHLVESLTQAERNQILAVARRLAAEAADRLGEPVEARVTRKSGTLVFAVRHVPGVTNLEV
jgi:hypothetical protein